MRHATGVYYGQTYVRTVDKMLKYQWSSYRGTAVVWMYGAVINWSDRDRGPRTREAKGPTPNSCTDSLQQHLSRGANWQLAFAPRMQCTTRS